MAWWFSYYHDGPAFAWLGFAHLAVFAMLFLVCVVLIRWGYVIRENKKLERICSYIMVTVFVAFEISYQIWYIHNGVWNPRFALPLHLSSMTWITAMLMLLTKRQRLFEFTFFAGVGSAFLTLITPDVGSFGFPHFRFFHFFMTHSLVIVAVVYMICVQRFYVELHSVFRSWIFLNIYAAFVFVINLVLPGANYMYLMHKPPGPSPFDWFGPWPYYIFVLQLVSLLLFLFMYGAYLMYERAKKINETRVIK